MTRLLITGGAGFIGSHLADHFIGRGWQVRVLDNLDPQVHPAGAPAFLNPHAEFIRADVRDGAALSAALRGVDAVVHAASAVGVAQSLYQVEKYVDVNVRGTATLLESMIRMETRPRLLLLSSMTVYGEGLYVDAEDRELRPPVRSKEDIVRYGWEPVHPETGRALRPVPIPESAQLNARNIYALTKKYQEELILSTAATYSFPATGLRLFNVFGPRQSVNNPYTGVLAIFIGRFLAGTHPVLYEDGLQTRDFVSVHDVVRAVELALGAEAAAGTIINIGSGTGRTVLECATELASRLGASWQPSPTGEFRTGDIRHCTAGIAKAQRILGFSPAASWSAALDELVAWAKSQQVTADFDRAQRELESHRLIK